VTGELMDTRLVLLTMIAVAVTAALIVYLQTSAPYVGGNQTTIPQARYVGGYYVYTLGNVTIMVDPEIKNTSAMNHTVIISKTPRYVGGFFVYVYRNGSLILFTTDNTGNITDWIVNYRRYYYSGYFVYIVVPQDMSNIEVAGLGAIHFMDHVDTGRPPSYTEFPGKDVGKCPGVNRTFTVEFDAYVLDIGSGRSRVGVRLEGFDGSGWVDLNSRVVNVEYNWELDGVTHTLYIAPLVGGYYVLGGAAGDTENVPFADEISVGNLRADVNPHTHVRLTFLVAPYQYYRVHGDNLDAPGRSSNYYFYFSTPCNVTTPQCPCDVFIQVVGTNATMSGGTVYPTTPAFYIDVMVVKTGGGCQGLLDVVTSGSVTLIYPSGPYTVPAGAGTHGPYHFEFRASAPGSVSFRYYEPMMPGTACPNPCPRVNLTMPVIPRIACPTINVTTTMSKVDGAYGVYPGGKYRVDVVITTDLVGLSHNLLVNFIGDLSSYVMPPSASWIFTPIISGQYTFDYEFSVASDAKPDTKGELIINLYVNSTRCAVMVRIPIIVLAQYQRANATATYG